MNHENELCQEFSDNGLPKSHPQPKSAFYGFAKLTGASHVWLWRQNSRNQIEILLQLRAPDKKIWPDFWDVSASGGINFRETPPDTAVRETHEELDIDIDPEKLFYIFSERFIDPGCQLIRHIFLYEFSDADNFNFSDGEVAKVKWILLEELKNWVKNPRNFAGKFVPYQDYYFAQLFEHLENLAKGLPGYSTNSIAKTSRKEEK